LPCEVPEKQIRSKGEKVEKGEKRKKDFDTN
jgi:hypothetical protein